MATTTKQADPITDSTSAFATQIADQIESFLVALRAIGCSPDTGRMIPFLLLETAQVSLAGARLGVQVDIEPLAQFQPDVGPEADIEELRLRLAESLGDVDTYSYVFDPYLPETVDSQLSDDLTSIATDLENGLRHYRRGDVAEALWWWQFSYVSNWGNLAAAVLSALHSVVAHDRLDQDIFDESDQLAVADEITKRSRP